MARYHINPETGNPNICTAKVKCKFTSEDGVTPPHYDSKSEAEKAAKAQSSEVISESSNSVEEEVVEAAPEAREAVPETQVEVAPIAQSVEEAVEKVAPTDDELRGPENFEKAVKAARKTVIALAEREKAARVKFKKLKKKARKLKSIRSKIKKRSKKAQALLLQTKKRICNKSKT